MLRKGNNSVISIFMYMNDTVVKLTEIKLPQVCFMAFEFQTKKKFIDLTNNQKKCTFQSVSILEFKWVNDNGIFWLIFPLVACHSMPVFMVADQYFPQVLIEW